MSEQIWKSVDAYYVKLLVKGDAALSGALKRSAKAGLPAINVAPNQGKLLHLFAKMMGAKRILEIGTLGGYSTIWLALALPPNGKLITLEFEPNHAAVAAKNIAAAKLESIVEIRQGKAIDSLKQLQAEKVKPFDFVFIDADKISTADYFLASMKLVKAGSVIVVDNVVRDGGIIDASSKDEAICGIRRFNEILAKDKRVTATALQTVGSKGYDGFALARVNSL